MAETGIPSPTNPRNDLTADYIRAILDYNPDSGMFCWRHRVFDCPRITRTWNTKHAGKIAGNVCAQGYITIGVDNHPRKAHRLAWLWMTGEWPVEVDHKDRNRTNNRWSNLRHADDSTNQHNRGVSKNNHSGYKGVIKVKRNGVWRGKWVARIAIKGKVFSSSECETAEAAHAEYCKMAQRYHGEFASLA